MVDFTSWTDYLLTLGAQWAPKLAGAIVTLILGWWAIGIIGSIFTKTLTKSKVDATLRTFLKSIVTVGLKVLLVITAISMLGVQMTSFIAVIGAAGLAVGLALQGSLGNFAGGALILFFKPFKVGDFISAQGEAGIVEEIQIFTTVLKTPDNKTIIVPNGALSNGNITNFSKKNTRRVDFVFGISYEDDFEKAKKIILKLIKKDKRILADPEPFCRVSALADSSVNITTRVWVDAADYWNVFFDMTENVKTSFDKENINIPYPQMDVHMKK